MVKHYAYVEILGDPGEYNWVPFSGEFNISSTEQVKTYMKQLADAEGLKSYRILIDAEVYYSTGEIQK